MLPQVHVCQVLTQPHPCCIRVFSAVFKPWNIFELSPQLLSLKCICVRDLHTHFELSHLRSISCIHVNLSLPTLISATANLIRVGYFHSPLLHNVPCDASSNGQISGTILLTDVQYGWEMSSNPRPMDEQVGDSVFE